jgi:hypothetical protein
MQFEYESKDAEQKAIQSQKDAVAAEAIKRQKYIAIFVAAGLLLAIGFSLLMYRNFLQKKRANILLEEKNTLIERKQKEILDSIHYAKRIQSALMPSEKYISRKLKQNKKG